MNNQGRFWLMWMAANLGALAWPGNSEITLSGFLIYLSHFIVILIFLAAIAPWERKND